MHIISMHNNEASITLSSSNSGQIHQQISGHIWLSPELKNLNLAHPYFLQEECGCGHCYFHPSSFPHPFSCLEATSILVVKKQLALSLCPYVLSKLCLLRFALFIRLSSQQMFTVSRVVRMKLLQLRC